ncbi:hypothetical protein ACG98G_01825 [Megasphaera hexanoica]|uniref:Uncharacterized protein n=1 Tax=Megasphaera hexanoica TaxID=1675036 RepID=A0A848BPB0_9FIRM|nr:MULTISPECIES: hypothetical protein [Megasphaera]MCI5531433.1 hypothetical protein [Caecibacter massiliensis]AXB82073.1 hypothetical protein ACT01_07390 [Megasphaera hexanoica]KUH56841.1 hypothetical protein AT798_10590 [Megasphaera sp. DJF_B143]MDY2904359.1 hypothetical protein [Caecibacter massiliensis]NME27562.1 hypothetical protein [Megasphaera hexanoica]
MKNLIVIGLFVLLVLSHLYPGSPVATLAMLTALVAIGGACVKLGEYIWGSDCEAWLTVVGLASTALIVTYVPACVPQGINHLALLVTTMIH